MAESYTPRTWTNGSGLPINATNLNYIEQGIEAIDDRVAAIEAAGTGGGTATVVDATTSVKGVARLLGGTADNPTVPWTSVTGAPAVISGGSIVTGYIPADAISTVATVTHSLGSTNLVIAVHDEITGAYPSFSVYSTNENAVQFTFSVAPTVNRYRYTIISPTTALTAPQVRDVPVPQAYAASLTINAAGGNSRIITATGNLTLDAPSNGADGQLLRVRVIASGAQRVVTFGSALKRPLAIASTLTIPSGGRGDIGLYYESTDGWSVLSAQGPLTAGSGGGGTADLSTVDYLVRTVQYTSTNQARPGWAGPVIWQGNIQSLGMPTNMGSRDWTQDFGTS